MSASRTLSTRHLVALQVGGRVAEKRQDSSMHHSGSDGVDKVTSSVISTWRSVPAEMLGGVLVCSSNLPIRGARKRFLG